MNPLLVQYRAVVVKEGLIAYRDDPEDNRRKIFYLVSKPVGSSVVPREDLMKQVEITIARSIGTPSTFLKGVIRSIVIGMEAIGFNMDPVLKDIGRRFGGSLCLNAEVRRPGRIQVGDRVTLVPSLSLASSGD